MNKGINLARGRVLAFLNAGNAYTDEDLPPCIQPILEGRTTAVAAVAEVYNENGILGGIWKPSLDQMFSPSCAAIRHTLPLQRHTAGLAGMMPAATRRLQIPT